jgi:hypothetical protein
MKKKPLLFLWSLFAALTLTAQTTINIGAIDTAYTDSVDSELVLDVAKVSSKIASPLLSYPNPFKDKTFNEATISFDVKNYGDIKVLGALFSIYDPTLGRMYLTNGSYLGYNANGGWIDANLDNYGIDSSFMDSTWNTVKLVFSTAGYAMYVNDTLAFNQSSTAVKIAGTLTDYTQMMSFFKNAASLVFGAGSFWSDNTKDDGSFWDPQYSYLKNITFDAKWRNINDVADEVTVDNVADLKTVIADATADRTIYLKNCADTLGYYYLTDAGINYPVNFVNLTLKPAPGEKPVLFGTFKSYGTRKMKLNTINFDGLTFKAAAAYDKEANMPFFFNNGADSILVAMNIKNCSFIDLGKSGGARLLQVKTPQGAVIKAINFENNIVDNYGGISGPGVHGQTLFQWNNTNPGYESDNITIKNNTFHNFHGNIFFNYGRQNTTSKDSTINITIENNTFYRFGGNGTSDRNFIEWTNAMGGVAANIKVNNNLFYKNWDYKNKKCFKLNLFNRKDSIQGTKMKLYVQNNFFYEDSVAFTSAYTQNLPITNSTTFPYTEYKAFTMDSLGLTASPFLDEAKADTTLDLSILKTNPLYKAGLNGAPIGNPSMYVYRSTPQTTKVKTLAELRNAIEFPADGDVIELENCQDEGGFYNLSSTGFDYPTEFMSLTVKPAAGHSPIVFGTFKSKTAKMKLKDYTIEGLIFDATDKADGEACAPIFMLANDSVMGTLTLKNNQFINLGKSGGGRIVDANSCDKSVVKKFVFENNQVFNFGAGTASGTHGQTFMQWRNSGSYEFDNITLRNNVIHGFHGNQFLNISRQKTSSLDSLMNITIENNTFYRFGGNGTSVRNFIEFTNHMGGVGLNVAVNNNLFYKNWEYRSDRFKNFRLHLFSAKDTVVHPTKIKVNVLNNFFYEDSVMFDKSFTQNLPLTNTNNYTYTAYKAFTMDSLGLKASPFIDEAKADTTLELSILKSNPLFKAGLNGAPIGAPSMYVYRQTAQTTRVKTLAELQAAIEFPADGDVIELENCQDEGGFYNLGTTGFIYPTEFMSLTIKPAPDHNPVVFGSFKSKTNKMKLKDYTIEGLTFNATDKTEAEGTAPIIIQGSDSILGQLTLKNNSFINLGKSGGGRILDANGSDKSVVKDFVFEGNLIFNFGATTPAGTHGQTFMQWRNSGAYEFDNITLRNNTIHSFHGNQFLNIGRQKTSSKDSLMNITVENNTFYRFGGNGTSVRNFIEFTNHMGGVAMNVAVNNNLFYKNWEYDHFKNFRLHLFNAKDSVHATKIKVDVLNNFFYEDSVMFAAGFDRNLPLTNTSSYTYNAYKAFTKDSLGITTRLFVDEAKADTTMDLEMYTQTPLMTAGLGGKPIGDPRWYTNTTTPPAWTALKTVKPSNLIAWSNNGFIYLNNAQKPVTIFNVLGQRVGVFTAEQATQGIDVKGKGVYLLRTDNETIRVMVR